jgi:molybdopterin biosynthesis enzyme
MCFRKYVAPALAHLAGRRRDERLLCGVAAAPFVNDDDRTYLTRVQIERRHEAPPLVTKLRHQGAHMLTGLVGADGFVTLEPGQVIVAGAPIEVSLF